MAWPRGKSLGGEWRAAAGARHIARDVNRDPGASGQVNHHFHQRAVFRLARQPAHHARYARREVNRLARLSFVVFGTGPAAYGVSGHPLDSNCRRQNASWLASCDCMRSMPITFRVVCPSRSAARTSAFCRGQNSWRSGPPTHARCWKRERCGSASPVAGIDADRARRGAQAIGRASIQRHVRRTRRSSAIELSLPLPSRLQAAPSRGAPRCAARGVNVSSRLAHLGSQ